MNKDADDDIPQDYDYGQLDDDDDKITLGEALCITVYSVVVFAIGFALGHWGRW